MIELAAMLRLIPYIIIAIIAWKNGYRRLTAVGVILVIVAVVNFTFKLDADMRGLLSIPFTLALTLHAVNLKSNSKEK